MTVTPRTTRLVRVGGLRAFREAVVALASAGAPADARDRLVVVPTRAAASQLLRTLEDTLLADGGAVLLPDMVTPDEIVGSLAARLGPDLDPCHPSPPPLDAAEREVLLTLACRAARDGGAAPPFRLRPGLVAEALRFYDALRRQQKDIATFERLALGALEPGASYDRGAERLVRQTQFLVAAFRDFERRSADAGADEHALRARLLREQGPRPFRDVVLTVTDRACDRHGLWPADWDLLTRMPGLEHITLVVTDATVAGALHERLHDLLPGMEELRFEPAAPSATSAVTSSARLASASAVTSAETQSPRLVSPPVHVVRDREEEVALFARRVRQLARQGGACLDRHALVVRQPLPYAYVAREVLRSAGIPSQTFDTLPLAAEPYAAATDLVLAAVTSNFARTPAVALLRSPHFRFSGPAGAGRHNEGPAEAGHYDGGADAGHYDEGPAEAGHYDAGHDDGDIDALDRALSEAGYLGDAAALDRIIDRWREAGPGKRRLVRALRAGARLQILVGELAPLRQPGPVAIQLSVLIDFLSRHDNAPGSDDPLRARQLRARSAVIGTLTSLRDAHARFDPAPLAFDEIAGLIRRWIESRTFSPRAGDTGVHIIDAESARFGSFDHVQLAGLVDGEWPERPQRNIFYSPAILRDLGWPQESSRADAARAAFTDLLRLPSARLVVSTFTLEADALVTPSPLVDEIEPAALEAIDEPLPDVRIFEHEALAHDPMVTSGLADGVLLWAERRAAAAAHDDVRFHGLTAPYGPSGYSLSGLERYQDCPFKFFASEVLRLQEPPEDESTLSPRARGRFIHEVFQRFFEAWDARGRGTIATDRIDEARQLFAAVADPLLAALPEAEAALERMRLFGSAISVGIIDVVLGLEASRPVDVKERWLEYRLEGEFTLAGPQRPALPSDDVRRVSLRGVADRIDLLAGRRLRVIDYKSGSAPNPKRALQVPIYALCAQERLMERDLAPWAVDGAAYVALSGKRALATVVKPGGADAAATLEDARERLFGLVDGIGRGEFPPRPHDPVICRYCAFSSVCRKDYVGDE